MAAFLLLALVVRLWFDIAQVRTVAQNERGMWRNTWKAFRITFRSLPSLFWMYFCISLFAWVTLVLGLVIWAKLPPTATPLTFVLLQLILLAQLTTRFWQLASAMTWYQRHAEVVPADSVDYTTPQPQEIAEPRSRRWNLRRRSSRRCAILVRNCRQRMREDAARNVATAGLTEPRPVGRNGYGFFGGPVCLIHIDVASLHIRSSNADQH